MEVIRPVPAEQILSNQAAVLVARTKGEAIQICIWLNQNGYKWANGETFTFNDKFDHVYKENQYFLYHNSKVVKRTTSNKSTRGDKDRSFFYHFQDIMTEDSYYNALVCDHSFYGELDEGSSAQYYCSDRHSFAAKSLINISKKTIKAFNDLMPEWCQVGIPEFSEYSLELRRLLRKHQPFKLNKHNGLKLIALISENGLKHHTSYGTPTFTSREKRGIRHYTIAPSNDKENPKQLVIRWWKESPSSYRLKDYADDFEFKDIFLSKTNNKTNEQERSKISGEDLPRVNQSDRSGIVGRKKNGSSSEGESKSKRGHFTGSSQVVGTEKSIVGRAKVRSIFSD